MYEIPSGPKIVRFTVRLYNNCVQHIDVANQAIQKATTGLGYFLKYIRNLPRLPLCRN